jgi:hypothetical protein
LSTRQGFQPGVSSANELDERTALDWLRAELGETLIQTYWGPILRARFGGSWAHMSALAAHGEIERCSIPKRHPHGAITGGLRVVTDGLRADALRTGAIVEPCGRIDAVSRAGDEIVVSAGTQAHRGRRIVLATSVREAQRVLAAGETHSLLDSMPDLEVETTVGWFEIDRPIFGNYWTAVDDASIPFQGLLELTPVRSTAEFGGRHVVGVVDRMARGPLDRSNAEARLTALRAGLARLQPDRPPPVVSRSRLSSRVEAFFPVRSFDAKPPFELVSSRVYLATDRQAFPEAPSLQSRLRIAERAVEHVLARERIDARVARSENVPAT